MVAVRLKIIVQRDWSRKQELLVEFLNCVFLILHEGFPGGLDGKESSCNAGDVGLIPGREDPLKKGMTTHFSILAWGTPWTEGPGCYSPWGHKESDTTER